MAEPILSYELKLLLDYIKTKLVTEFPINTITTNYIVLAILDSQNCDGYSVISKLMMHSAIHEFKDFMSNCVLSDCQSDIKQANTESRFSSKYDELADIISNEGKTVTSAILFDKIVETDQQINNKLASLGVTLDQLHDVVIAYSHANTHKYDARTSPKRVKKKPQATQIQKTEEVEPVGHKVIPEESNTVEANCTNLVRIASNGIYDDIIGFDNIVDDIFDVLGKYDRNSVAIIGPNGVGKTSVVKRLAKRIYDEKCPVAFKNKYVMQFGDAINSLVISEMNRIGKYIAFIDDLDKLFLNKETEMNNIYVLTELLKSPNICTIVCMNDTQYSKNVESRPSFARYFHKIRIDEPSEDELIDIIWHSAKSLCEYNSIKIEKEHIKESIRLAKRFITNEKCPKSAMNILDMACSHLRMTYSESNELKKLKMRLNEILLEKNMIPNSASAEEYDRRDQLIRNEISIKSDIDRIETAENNTELTLCINDVKYAASKMTGIPVTEMDEDNRSKLKNLYANLTEHVIGQDDAVSAICRAVKRQRVGLSNPNKPCCMLFCGTTGVGKSFLAKRLAFEMFGNENDMVRLDMSEYSDKTSVTKLYGASAGYIGYEEGGILTEAVKKKPRCVLLLDEIEKAHDDVYNVFLQVFDEGRLSDNKGNVVDFKNVIIIMTSNVGAKDISEKPVKIGFNKTDNDSDDKDIIMNSIKKEFKPEFINRIDNICYFNKLTDDNIRTIIINEIKKVKKKVMDLGYDLDNDICNGKLVDDIFSKVKSESEYGARPVIREIQTQLEDKLTDYIIDNDIQTGFVFKYNDIYC